MRAVEHYQQAEQMLDDVTDDYGAINQGEHTDVILAATVHATLALAGATALGIYCRVEGSEKELADWEAAAGGEDG